MAEEEADPQLSSPESSEPQSPLHLMLTSIADERKKFFSEDMDSGFELVPRNAYSFWTDMFKLYFASGGTSPDDDMLFYIRRSPDVKDKNGQMTPLMEVCRRNSKNLPKLDDPTIDWEETVYLNIIMHQFDYKVTCAVCTRTGATELQMLKKCTKKLFASPTKRDMDSKGTGSAVSYPNIYFNIDQFEEAFEDLIVRDSEFVAVELVAADKKGSYESTIFQGSVKYEALKRTYDNRTSMTSRMMQKMSFGLYRDQRRVEFMKMRGPRGKGHAQMAVSRVKGSGPETPKVEDFPVSDFEDEEKNQYTTRRMSDPSSTSGSRFPGGFRRAMSMKKSRSDTENMEGCLEKEEEEVVVAGTFQDELDEEIPHNGLWGWSFAQAWHHFKERRRANCISLQANLTYITLPWHHIIADLLENKSRPVLTH